ASRGALFVRGDDAAFRVKASRGLPVDAPAAVAVGDLPLGGVLRASPAWPQGFEASGLEIACPIVKGARTIAVLGLGPRADGRAYAPEDAAFLRSVAACAATPIENGLIYDELLKVNRKLSVKVFQLHNLFDISRELTASFDEEDIKKLATSTLMGHLMVSRCALYLRAGDGLALAHERGLRTGGESVLISEAEARPV